MLPLSNGALVAAIVALPVIQACSAQVPDGCIALDTRYANGHSQVQIYEPGDYCLTQDLHARIELADRPAETTLIQISGSGIRLDLGGHTLGRGRIFRNPGGVGITIDWRYTDIVISNGRLADFRTAIVLDADGEGPAYEQETNTYTFPRRGITVKDVIFERNKRQFY